MSAGVATPVVRVGGANGDKVPAQSGQFLVDHSWGGGDSWGVKQGVPVGSVSALGEVAGGCLEERLQLMPAGVTAGGEGLADPGRAIAQADVAIAADRGGELGEPAVFFGDDEVSVAGWRLRAGGLGGRDGRSRKRGELISPLVLGIHVGHSSR